MQLDMNHIKIIEAFKNKEHKSSPPYIISSVLLPIIDVDKEPHLLFEVRSHQLKSQPGEICFPGGKVDADETLRKSAVRETIEELNIKAENIEIIGKLDPVVTTFNMIIYPFCAFLQNIKLEDINYSTDEVDSIFTVPIKEIISQKPLLHRLKVTTTPDENFPFHLISQGEDYSWKANDYYVYFYKYKEKVIWGITAKILKNFLDILSD